MYVIDWLDRAWFGITLKRWLIAAATMGGVYIALALLQRFVVRRLGALAQRTETRWDDFAIEIARRTRPYFLALIAAYAATRVVPLPGRAERIVSAIAVVVLLIQAGVWGNGLITFGAEHYSRKRTPDDIGTRTTITAIGYAARFALWMLLVVTALQNFGINVTALVTGLGIGGIAIALAVQNILGDLFAALAIVLDQPFVVGDSVQVDNVEGTIEHVGLKTTRIRSIRGEQVVIANADLLKSRIRNYKRMQHRRAVFNLDLSFDTPPDKIARVPGIVRQIVEKQSNVRFDRSHWLTIEPTGLRVETVYNVLDADYMKYADVQQAINVEVLRALQKESIQLGYSTRTLTLAPLDR